MDRALVERLQDPALFDHEVSGFRLIETHISWVLLTGRFAYKIKRPVDFGFLDFSTRERRRFFCREEVRLNRRLAAELYVDTVAIVRRPDGAPALAPDEEPPPGGEPLDTAVRMRQFDPDASLSRLAAAGRLRADTLVALARTVAAFHERADRAGPDTPWGTPEETRRWIDENFDQVRPRLTDAELADRLDALAARVAKEETACRDLVLRRKADGFVRECHGDLHLGNVARIDGRPVPFDCIEFNPSLRWIDVVSEIAFLWMDLLDRGAAEADERRALAFVALDAWAEATGDRAGLALLRRYAAYRAMVRAKVAMLGDDAATFRDYLTLAETLSAERRPALVVTCGLSGSGKSHLAEALVARLGALRVRSDVERKRLHGLPPLARTGAAPREGIYDAEATRRTYDALLAGARSIVAAGLPAIVDAAFLRREERERFRRAAEELGAPFLVLHADAPRTVLERRVAERERRGDDPSEAGLAVLRGQRESAELPGADERDRTVVADTATPDATARAAEEIRRRLGEAG